MRERYGHASPEYRAYLKSALWRERRRAFFEKHPRKCEACDRRAKYRKWYQPWKARLFIVLHHVSYESQIRSPGNEPDSDLRALCNKHHTEVHARYDNGQFATLQECTDWLIKQGQDKLAKHESSNTGSRRNSVRS
jgi:hypothetical protein